jgi:hypothetical protein
MLHHTAFTVIDGHNGKLLPVKIVPDFKDVMEVLRDKIMVYRIYYSLNRLEQLYGDLIFNLEGSWMFQGNHLSTEQQIQLCMRVYQLPQQGNY